MDIRTEQIARMIIESGAADIREIPEKVSNEEVSLLLLKHQPFLYSSGNWGPGYISIKGMVSFPEKMDAMGNELGRKVSQGGHKVKFVAGNLTGGVIPAWILKNYLSREYNIPIGFLYVYGSRSLDGKRRLVAIDESNWPLLLNGFRSSIQNSQNEGLSFDFIAGCVPTGMPFAYELSKEFNVPFVYIREERKKGGHKELITGNKNNPLIQYGQTGLVIGKTEDLFASSQAGVEILENEGYNGMSIGPILRDDSPFLSEFAEKITYDIQGDPQKREGLFAGGNIGIDIEELVNYSQTTCTSCLSLRLRGYQIRQAGTILYYDNPTANSALEDNGIEMIYVIKLRDVIEVAKKMGRFSPKAIDDYLSFLSNPSQWQKTRGLTPIQGGGTL